MKTIRGYFNGTSVELLEDEAMEEGAYVLVTFLEGGLAAAAARGQRLQSARDALRPPHVYSEELRKQMASQYRRFTVGSIMTRKVISVSPSTTVANTLHLMRLQGITSVLVEPEGEGGEWGIMTMRDLLKQIVIAESSPEKVLAGDIASKPVISVSPETSLRDCSKLMVDSNVRRLVVTQDGHHVGIVSDTDIFQTVEEHGWGSMASGR